MHSFLALVLAFFLFQSIHRAHAALYVIRPKSGSTCHGGSSCTIQWLDDGDSPPLTSFGVCTIGLYTGEQQLVQTIEPLDVSASHSLTFTPTPGAGPDSDTYYIGFASTTLTNANGSAVLAFSPYFELDQMSGDFSSPLASATSSIPIPSASGTSGDSDTTVETITVGTLSTSLPPISTLSATTPSLSSSRLTTATRSSSSPSASSTGSATSSNTASPSESANSASTRTSIVSPTLMGILSLCLFVVCAL